jgi:hypothetical protein
VENWEMPTITWTKYYFKNFLLIKVISLCKIISIFFLTQVLALVREQIVIQGYDRIALPDGDFSFTYVLIYE